MRRLTGSIVLFAACLASTVSSAQGIPTWSYPPGLQPGDVYHVMFVTRNTFGVTGSQTVPPGGNSFGGLDAGDWQVTWAAFEASLPGMEYRDGDRFDHWNGQSLIYQAVLSTHEKAARGRIPILGPVYNTNAEVLAGGHGDLWDGSLRNPVGYDEYAQPITSWIHVWTGTGPGGSVSSDNCADWTDGGVTADVGNALLPDSQWVIGPLQEGTARLYGVSAPIMVPTGNPAGDGVYRWDNGMQITQWNAEPYARFSYMTSGNATHYGLHYADFRRAKLPRADFRHADLTSADLSGANATGADFDGAKLPQAALRGANLTDARFVEANLTGADLRDADLTNTNFRDATLAGADLRGVDLSRTNLWDSTLSDADFTGAIIHEASLRETTDHGFTSAQFYSTASYANGDLQRIRLNHCDLTGWNFSDKDLEEAHFTAANLTNANFNGADLTNADLYDCVLAGADFSGAEV